MTNSNLNKETKQTNKKLAEWLSEITDSGRYLETFAGIIIATLSVAAEDGYLSLTGAITGGILFLEGAGFDIIRSGEEKSSDTTSKKNKKMRSKTKHATLMERVVENVQNEGTAQRIFEMFAGLVIGSVASENKDQTIMIGGEAFGLLLWMKGLLGPLTATLVKNTIEANKKAKAS